jgi:hypothetical protein
MELTRLIPEMLPEMGFKKISYIDEDTNKEVFHYELPLSKTTYQDFVLISNPNDEEDFPVIQFCGVDEYEIKHVEPLVLLINLLQSCCVVDEFVIDKQFSDEQ